MASIVEDFRKRFPQYDDLNDFELATALHGQYQEQIGQEIPLAEFSARIGGPRLETRELAIPPLGEPAPAPVLPDLEGVPSVLPEISAPPVLGAPPAGPPVLTPEPAFAPGDLQDPRVQMQAILDVIASLGAEQAGPPAELAGPAPTNEIGRQAFEAALARAPGPGARAEPLPGEPPLLRRLADAIFGSPSQAGTPQAQAEAVIEAQAGRQGLTGPQLTEEVGARTGVAERVLSDVAAGGVGVGSGLLGFASRVSGQEGLRAGQVKLDELAQELLPNDPNFGDQLAAGFGSAAAFFIPGLGIVRGAQAFAQVAPSMALWLGSSAAAGLEAAVEAGTVYNDAIAAGKSREEAAKRADTVFFSNAALVGVTNRFGLFGERGGQLARRTLGAAVEGGQEAAQQVISNVALERPPGEDVPTSGAIGAIVGGGLSGGPLRRREPREQPALAQPAVAEPAPAPEPVAGPEDDVRTEAGQRRLKASELKAAGVSLPEGWQIWESASTEDARKQFKGKPRVELVSPDSRIIFDFPQSELQRSIQNRLDREIKDYEEIVRLRENPAAAEAETNKRFEENFAEHAEDAKFLPPQDQAALREAVRDRARAGVLQDNEGMASSAERIRQLINQSIAIQERALAPAEPGEPRPPTAQPERQAPPPLAAPPAGTKTFRGTFYFNDRNTAQTYAQANGWPTNRILDTERGFAIQFEKSGTFAGPEHLQQPREEVTDAERQREARADDAGRRAQPGVRPEDGDRAISGEGVRGGRPPQAEEGAGRPAVPAPGEVTAPRAVTRHDETANHLEYLPKLKPPAKRSATEQRVLDKLPDELNLDFVSKALVHGRAIRRFVSGKNEQKALVKLLRRGDLRVERPSPRRGDQGDILVKVGAPAETPAPAAERVSGLLAAVQIDDRVFTGRTHAQALREAFNAGALVRNEEGESVSPTTGERANTDLFRLASGEIINRSTADRRFGASTTETFGDLASAERAREEGRTPPVPSPEEPAAPAATPETRGETGEAARTLPAGTPERQTRRQAIERRLNELDGDLNDLRINMRQNRALPNLSAQELADMDAAEKTQTSEIIKERGRLQDELRALAGEQAAAPREEAPAPAKAETPEVPRHVRVTRRFTVEETGEEVEIELNAREALRLVDKRIAMLGELRKCLQ